MALLIDDRGRNNEIRIADDVMRDGVGVVLITGDDNLVSIAAASTLTGASIQVGSRCTVMVDGARLAASEMFCAADSTISIGRDAAFTWKTQILAHEKSDIRIGAGCLFATNSVVTVSDMHSIIDVATGARLNPARDVTIADHVWIGLGCVVMKGVTIGEGSIVGAGSMVTRDIPSNSLAAGSPVRILRRGVTWTAGLL